MGFGEIIKDIRNQKNSSKENYANKPITSEQPHKPIYGKKIEKNYDDAQLISPQNQSTYFKPTSSDPRHGSIIKRITKNSGENQNYCESVTWVECKHLKKRVDLEYCTEYHSLCAKEKCKRAKS